MERRQVTFEYNHFEVGEQVVHTTSGIPPIVYTVAEVIPPTSLGDAGLVRFVNERITAPTSILRLATEQEKSYYSKECEVCGRKIPNDYEIAICGQGCALKRDVILPLKVNGYDVCYEADGELFINCDCLPRTMSKSLGNGVFEMTFKCPDCDELITFKDEDKSCSCACGFITKLLNYSYMG